MDTFLGLFDPRNFKGQATSEAKRLVNKYDTTTYMIGIKTENEFIKEWNSMGKTSGKTVNIEGVSLLFHGSPNEIMLDEGAKNQKEYLTTHPDGTTTISGTEATYIKTLQSKSFKTLNLLICNSELVDFDGSNPVSVSDWKHKKYTKNLAITFLEHNKISEGVNAMRLWGNYNNNPIEVQLNLLILSDIIPIKLIAFIVMIIMGNLLYLIAEKKYT